MFYAIQTATQEFRIPGEALDRLIESFLFDGYRVLNDDTQELTGEGDRAPLVVYRRVPE